MDKNPRVTLSSILAMVETIQRRYDGDNDTIPGAPPVLWADSLLAHAVGCLLGHVQDLENRMDSHAHPMPYPRDPRPAPIFPPPVYVFCKGGVVNDVTDSAGVPYAGACIIDYDHLNDGICPICHEMTIPGEAHCPRCTFSLNKNSGIGEALRAAHVLENQKGE